MGFGLRNKNKILKKDNVDKIIINNEILSQETMRDFVFSDKINFMLPKQSQSVHFVTNREFNSIEIIEKIVNDDGCIEDASIAVYSINKTAVEKIINLNKNGKIKNANFIFSTIRNDRGENLESCYKKLVDCGKFKIGFFYSHSKVMCLKTYSNFYVIEMSCNLAHNSRIENITFFNNKELFDFHSGWIKKLIENQ